MRPGSSDDGWKVSVVFTNASLINFTRQLQLVYPEEKPIKLVLLIVAYCFTLEGGKIVSVGKNAVISSG